MKTSGLTAILLLTVLNSFGQQGVGPSATPSQTSDSKVGEHFKVIPGADGTHEITLVANGLNYQDTNGNWIESIPIVQSFSSAIVCTGASYRVILATNLNSYGSVDMELPTDPATGARGRMVSHPLGIAFYDPDSGGSVLLAQLKDCSAQIVSNKIIFADAFAGSNGIEGSVTYTYDVGHFHQDITLTAKPSVTPADFGMGANTRLEMLTEIVQSPTPVITEAMVSTATRSTTTSAMTAPSLAQPAATDQTLNYGTMQMGIGRAFSIAAPTAQNALPVIKRLVNIESRTVLTEDVPWNQAAEALQVLPPSSVSASPAPQASAKHTLPRPKMLAQMNVPSPHPGKQVSFNERLAEVSRLRLPKIASLNTQLSALNSPRGFVMDYEIVQTCSDYTFLTGHTYFINSSVEMWYATIQSGAVIKLSASGNLRPTVAINCPDYAPMAVITDMNDDSVGETITNSLGHIPGSRAYVGLDLSQLDGYGGYVHNLDIRFVGTGIQAPEIEGDWCYVYDCWFFECGLGANGTDESLSVFTSDFCNVSMLYSPSDIYAYDNTTCTADRNGNGLPDTWEMTYFAGLNHSASELDADGNTLLYDYQNSLYPDQIAFSIGVTNNYVTTNSPRLSMEVTTGTAAYYSVLVDNTNFAGATWTSYTSSNITASLGSTQGWHEIWVGLKGPASGATVTWQWKQLKLDYTPPSITVTNPGTVVVVQPVIELQGYCPERLDRITYDISNSSGSLTNQDIFVVDQFYDSNNHEFTTNYFQGFDIRLAPGLNTITLHAADEAGNTTNVVLNYTFDFSGKASPIVTLYWPQDGAEISGSTFTWRGHVDDFTAKLSATVSGNSQIFQALVERDGDFWVEDLPLPSGTSVLTLTATDVAGNVATKSITVTKSAIALTVDSLGDDLWQDSVTVTGTIDTSGYTIWVNGVQATQSGTSWSASDVPNVSGGTAIFQARAIPNSDNNGNGSGGSGAMPQASNMGNPNSSSKKDAELQKEKGWKLYEEHYETAEDSWAINTGPYNYSYYMTHNLSMHNDYNKGGDGTSSYHWTSSSDLVWWTQDWNDTYFWQSQPLIGGTIHRLADYSDYIHDPSHSDTTWIWSLPNAREHCNVKQGVNLKTGWPASLSGSGFDSNAGGQYHRTADVRMKLFTGAKGVMEESMWAFTVDVNEVTNHIAQPIQTLPPTYPPNISRPILPKSRIVLGAVGSLEDNGYRFRVLPCGATVDLTVDVKGVDYFEYMGSPLPWRYDLVRNYGCQIGTAAKRDVGVGEVVDYGFDSQLPTEASPVTWATSAGTVSDKVGFSTKYTAQNTANATANVTVTIHGETLTDEFAILEPTGVDHVEVLSRDPYPIGKQGAGMSLKVYMAPTSVSFSHVQFEEVGENASSLSGWFVQNGAPSHIGNGADTWFGVDCNNAWTDHAWTATYDPWVSGGYTWNIPAKWKVGNNGNEHSLSGWNQVFNFSSDGTTTLSKFGWTLTRNQNEVYGTTSK